MTRFKLGKSIDTQLRESGFSEIYGSPQETIVGALDLVKSWLNEDGRDSRNAEWYIAPNEATGRYKEQGYSVYYRHQDNR